MKYNTSWPLKVLTLFRCTVFFSIFKVTIKEIEFITIVLLAIVFNTLSNIKEYYDIMVIVYLVSICLCPIMFFIQEDD